MKWKWGLLLVGICGVLISIISTSFAINCYICQNCEYDFNETHIASCPRGRSARCSKIQYQNGIVDRACGDTLRCRGREGFSFPAPTERPRRPVLDNIRRKRALLGDVKEQKGEFEEAASVYCCNEDECNESSSHLASSLTYVVPILSLLMR